MKGCIFVIILCYFESEFRCKDEIIMKKVVITGATGFVGAGLARRLLQDGHQVHLLLRPGYNPWRIQAIRQQVQLHQVELADADAVAQSVGQIRPDWIFHLAVYGAYAQQTDLMRMIQTNITATATLLHACLKTGFEAFVNTGSSSEYGFKDHAPPETERVDPNSAYAVTKVSATLLCRYFAHTHKLNIPTLRLYSVYGPYEEPTRLIPTTIVRGLRGELPPLVNPGIARDYVYAEDVYNAYLLAASTSTEDPGAIYNVGTGVQTTLQEVVEIARRTLDIPAAPQWGSMPDRAWDTSVWVADSRKIRHELGWRPKHTFEQGFRLTVDWLRSDAEMRKQYEAMIGL